jgi:hypothetical protein
MLKPAIRKYNEVLKNDKKVDWLANIVLCNASRSLRIKSLLIALFKLIF